MVDVECRTARPGGVTLVAVRLDNRVEAPGVEAHRVRLLPRVDGPVWPPRVEGVPAAPWDCDGDAPSGADAASGPDAASDSGASDCAARENAASDGADGPAVEVVVPTGRVGSVGFASPAPPGDPPVEVETVEPAPAGDAPDEGDGPSPEDVLRVLGDPSPPRDAVAVGETASEEDASDASAGWTGADRASEERPGGGP